MVTLALVKRRVGALVTNALVALSTTDEDTIMDHADFDCLSWKEILSLIDDYYKVNSFLVERMS
jgi:hypothetical protein